MVVAWANTGAGSRHDGFGGGGEESVFPKMVRDLGGEAGVDFKGIAG